MTGDLLQLYYDGCYIVLTVTILVTRTGDQVHLKRNHVIITTVSCLLIVFLIQFPSRTQGYMGVDLRFPWESSQQWTFGTSWHGDPNYPLHNLDWRPQTGQPMNVLAMHGGLLTIQCEGSVSINLIITYNDGVNQFRTLYAHLDKNSVPGNLIDSNISQGTIIGQLYGGDFPNGDYDSQGFSCGSSTGPHLHLELPSQYITIDGWTVQGGNIWTKNGVTKTKDDTFPSTNSVSGQPYRWIGWETLNGFLASKPTVVSWAPGRLDVLARGTDNALWHRFYQNPNWSSWESLGSSLANVPAVVSWAPGRLDVFARGLDNALWHRFYQNPNWSSWESLGGGLADAPAVVSWAPGRLDLFGRGLDNALWHRFYQNPNWSSWESLGGGLANAPAVVSWAPGRLDLFGRGLDNALWHRFYQNPNWSSWETFGGGFADTPTVVSWAPGRLDLFGRGLDNALWYRFYQDPNWSSWETFGGGISFSPSVVSWGQNRLDVFVTGIDGALWRNYYTTDNGISNPIPTYRAQYISQSNLPTMTVGSVQTVQVRLKNTGTATWDNNTKIVPIPRNVNSNFYDPSWESQIRIVSTGIVAPGQDKVFEFILHAPEQPNHYVFQISLMQEGVVWFTEPAEGQISFQLDVASTPVTPTPVTPTPVTPTPVTPTPNHRYRIFIPELRR